MSIQHFLKIAVFLAICSALRGREAAEIQSAKRDDNEPQRQWPCKDELEVSLTVLHALEDGPFVCQVNLKNISKRPLEYATDYRDDGVECRVNASWRAKKEPLMKVFAIHGMLGPYYHRLFPGESALHTFYLHQSFLEVPAGEVPVRFGWTVYRTRKTATKETDSHRVETLELLFTLERTQTVKVLPATKENVAALLRKLEADFARAAKTVEGQKDYIWTNVDPTQSFVKTLVGSRRKEFVPLLLRAVDRLPASDSRRQLVATVYESFDTPEKSFDVLADYLDSPCPAAAVEVFDYWDTQESNHKNSERRQAELREKRKHSPDSERKQLEDLLLQNTRSEEEAWRTSKRHPDTRLTEKQFERLFALKNVWVRALLYNHFPDRCSPAWVQTLLADFRQVAQPPKRLLKLLDQLDDDAFLVREQASKELAASRDAVIVYFWNISREKLSPEASRRLRQLMKGVVKPELPPLWRRSIAHFACSEKPHVGQMLETLRKGDPATLIAQTAQTAFEDRVKRDERIKRLTDSVDDK
jgi:hypothetical protein